MPASRNFAEMLTVWAMILAYILLNLLTVNAAVVFVPTNGAYELRMVFLLHVLPALCPGNSVVTVRPSGFFRGST